MRWSSAWLILASSSHSFANEPPARPIAAWAAGPLEARVAFDRDVPESLAKALVGTRIVFGDDVKAGDRYVEPKAGDPASDRGSLRVAAARVEGPLLILATDPHSRDATYALHLPAPVDADLTYRLRGVEAVSEGSGSPAVWASLDSSRIARRVDSKRPTRLILKTLVALPKGKATLSFAASVPFSVDVGSESSKSTPGQGKNTAEVTTEVETDVVDLAWTLELDGATPLTFSALCRTGGETVARPLATEQLILPWAPPRPSAAADTPVPPAVFSGGDPAKGAILFKGDQAKCATCHRVRSEGNEVGPDLSELFRRDRAWIYRQINDPSASIHPDYVPYVVQTKDGRALAGIVRAEGADAIRVVDTAAKATVIPKADIEELKPSATSIMPVGLLGAIGEEGVKDLLAFLTTAPPAKR